MSWSWLGKGPGILIDDEVKGRTTRAKLTFTFSYPYIQVPYVTGVTPVSHDTRISSSARLQAPFVSCLSLTFVGSFLFCPYFEP